MEATFKMPPRWRFTIPSNSSPVSSTSVVALSWIIAKSVASWRSVAERPWPPTPVSLTGTTECSATTSWTSRALAGWDRSTTGSVVAPNVANSAVKCFGDHHQGTLHVVRVDLIG